MTLRTLTRNAQTKRETGWKGRQKGRKTRHDKSKNKKDETRQKLTVRNCQLGRAKNNLYIIYIFVYLHRNYKWWHSDKYNFCHQAVADSNVPGSKPVETCLTLCHFYEYFFTFIYMYYGPPILKVFRIMDLNLKRFLAYYGKIILMPEILMGSNSCSSNFKSKFLNIIYGIFTCYLHG